MGKIFIAIGSERPGFQKKVLGVSLLGRLINELALLGEKEAHVISETGIDPVKKAVEREILPSISLIWSRPRKNKTVFESAVGLAAEQSQEITYLPSDLLISRKFLKEVLDTTASDEKPLVFCPAERINTGQIVKLSAVQVKSLHKKGSANPSALSVFEKIFVEGFCSQVENAAQIKEAKQVLLQSLRKPVDIDGVLGYYLMRPITLRITSILANLPVLPNHITVLTAMIGLAGACMVAFGDSTMAIVGAGLYFAACYFDCIDGEIARVKYKMSYLGAWLDTLSDDIQTFAFTGAAGLHLVRQGESTIFLVMALLTMVIFAITQGYIYHQLHHVFHSGDLLDFKFVWDQPGKGDAPESVFYSLIKYSLKRDFFTALFFVLFLLHIPVVVVILLFLFCTGYFMAVVYHMFRVRKSV